MSTDLSLHPFSPRGFRENPSTGLLLPDVVSRAREVWTRDEWKVIDRATKFLDGKRVKFNFACPDCKERMQMLVDGPEPVLRCGCKDRVWSRR